MSEILLARQPIFNSYLNLVAYELLYRDQNLTFNQNVNPDQASVTVILNALSKIGLPKLSGDFPVFINFTRELILSAPWSILPRDKVVIEVLENTQVDTELLEVLRKAKHFGYQIALDDFVFNESLRPLLDLADIIKLDVMALSEQQLLDQLDILQGYNVELLAEKVETYEMLSKCKQFGFDYFQGYFLSEPSIVSTDSLLSSQKEILEIIGKLHSSKPDIAVIEDLLNKEANLRNKLFKVINSEFYDLKKPVSTLQEAADAIGLEQVRNWVDIIMLCSTGNKPPEFFSLVLQRAAMCKILAQKLNLNGSETFFTVGLLSALNALLDAPKTSVLSSLAIQPDLKSALQDYQGETGKILHLVLAYERGDWAQANLPPLTNDDLCKAYIESIEWSRKVIAIIGQSSLN
jgi:EAL and modified HD-GYP domain-containing signal transduction protein